MGDVFSMRKIDPSPLFRESHNEVPTEAGRQNRKDRFE